MRNTIMAIITIRAIIPIIIATIVPPIPKIIFFCVCYPYIKYFVKVWCILGVASWWFISTAASEAISLISDSFPRPATNMVGYTFPI
jgi:hypothetical protein